MLARPKTGVVYYDCCLCIPVVLVNMTCTRCGKVWKEEKKS